MVGEWKISVAVDAMPEKLATAFGELQIVGAEYEPIAYLGSQLVNGINHAVLAEQTLVLGKDIKNVVVMIFNERGDNFTLANIERVLESGDGMGAIKVDVNKNIPKEAQETFDAAFDGFVGSNVKPFAYLGSQVVNGFNYFFACEVVPVVKDPIASVALVTVNSNTKQISFNDLISGTNGKALGYAFTWLKSKAGRVANGPGPVLGKWKVNVVLDGMPQKVATAFGKLGDLIGASYTPIAYLGAQVVNGTNHAVLAEQTLADANATKNIVIVIFNEPAGEELPNLSVVSIKTLVEGGDGYGGTKIDVETGDNINKTAQRLFDQRFGGFVGSVVTPFALLGTQIVRGTNFIFACESTPVLSDNDEDNKKAVLVIMNDLSEDVQFIDMLQPEINRSLGAPLGEWP